MNNLNIPNFTYNGFIYCWINLENQKKYIGSHWGSIEDNYKGSGIYFKRAYNKNPNNFIRIILEYCYCKDVNELRNVYEQKWLNLIEIPSTEFYNISNNASGWPSGDLNISKINHPWKNRKHTEESKLKMSKTHTGKKLSKEHKNKIKKYLNTHKNSIWINDGTKHKRIKPEELDEYLNDGWCKGQTQEMIDNAQKGKEGWKQPESQKRAVSKKMTKIKSKNWKVIKPNGEIEILSNLFQYCKDNKLDCGNMVSVSKGRLKQHKGYKCVKL